MNGNAAAWFVDRHPAEGRGDNAAFREAGTGRRLTYGALAHQAARLGGALLRAGVRREERALMLVHDTLEFPIIFWGAIKAGVVPVPLNTMLGAEVYSGLIQDSRPAILFVSAPLCDTVSQALSEIESPPPVIVAGDTAPQGSRGLKDFMAGAEPVQTAPASPDEVAFWLYSSGSTGAPKGVRHVHGSMQVTAETYGARVLGIEETDIIFSAAKLFFAYGLGNGMSFPMSVGAEAVLFGGRPTPSGISDILQAERPTIYCGVPTLYAALLAHWEGSGVPDLALRRCISAGEALPAEIGTRWQTATGTEVLDGVGSTEMLHIFLSNRPGAVEPGTSGEAVPGYEVRLVDEPGAPVADGEIGEMLVRGASSAADYWNQRAKSRATFEGVWTRTGDKYTRRADGRYIYCGRTDDMFKVSGQWVSPFEVEQAIVAYPGVLEAAVVAARDDDGLDKPKAFVVLKEGVAEDSLSGLKEAVQARVGLWKYPRWVEVVDDLPKTATGKIQRFRLRGG